MKSIKSEYDQGAHLVCEPLLTSVAVRQHRQLIAAQL
jgi:hypothetical protein